MKHLLARIKASFNRPKMRFISLAIGVGLGIALTTIYFAPPFIPQLYLFKRLAEKGFSTLMVTPALKIDYQLYLADKRMAELMGVVGDRRFGCVLQSAQRYSSTAGEATNLIMGEGSPEQARIGAEKLTGHKKSLELLLNSYPKDQDGEWKYLVDDVNYVEVYLRQLKERTK